LHDRIDKLAAQAIRDGAFTGAEILFACGEQLLLHRAYGRTSPEAHARPLKTGRTWDLASLTKPLATGAAILALYEDGALGLDDKASKYLPEWVLGKKISLTDLLTHRSGLPDWLPLYQEKDPWAALMSVEPLGPVGVKVVYSCLNFLILGEVVRRVSKQSLEQYCQTRLYRPLGLESLAFNPGPRPEVLETAFCLWRRRLLLGEVHDENAGAFGGEGGNAGLFGNAMDLWGFAKMLLAGGSLNGVQVFKPDTVALMLKNHNPASLAPRALAWDYYKPDGNYWSCGNRMNEGSFGHLGYTGTSLWVDPKAGWIVISLSHRVQIGREETQAQIRAFRPELCNLLIESKL